MSAPTRQIALPCLALLAALVLAGCGGSGATQSKSAKSAGASSTSAASGGAEHPVNMFPVLTPPSGEEQATVIHVGAEPITKADFVHWAGVLTPKIASYEPKSRVDCSSVRASSEVKLSKQKAAKLSATQIQALCLRQKQNEVKESALQQMISNRWVIGEAAELGLGVSEAEGQAQLDKVVSQQFKSKAEFLSYIGASGRTLADTLLSVRVSMATERIQELIKHKAEKKLTEAAIARYYHEHEKSLSIPETRDIRAIRTWTHTAIAMAMAEVRAGKSIASVAKRVSIDKPSNEHGGLTTGIVKGQEEAGLDQAIFAARPHVLTGPLHLRKRYYVFEVVKVTPGQEKSLKEIEGIVREKLSEALLMQEKARFIAAFRKKWLARTSCSPAYVVSRCREYTGRSVVLGEDPYEVR
jgi:parvulin-like peptidyl-prolyl isomerase